MAEPGKIEFIDLKAQQARIRESLQRRVQAVLNHGAYIMGPEVTELESKLCSVSKARHCLSCASGTDALLLPLMALGIGPGDAILVPSFTFVATAEVVRLLGATPVFVDSDPHTFNLAPEGLEAALARIKKIGKKKPLRARGIIPVDLFGLPANYEQIERFAKKRGLFVLQDAAQSLGARYRGLPMGAVSPITATSFFPSKPLGCYGDGGAVFTDDAKLMEKLRSIRVHGQGADKYDNVRVGLNARLDTLQAAVLLAKLEVFEDELHRRQEVAARYSRGLKDLVVTPEVPGGSVSAWAQYSILCRNSAQRDTLARELKTRGIPTHVYYPKPLHLQRVFKDLGYRRGECKVAEKLSATILSLPMHPYLSAEQQDFIIEAVKLSLR